VRGGRGLQAAIGEQAKRPLVQPPPYRHGQIVIQRLREQRMREPHPRTLSLGQQAAANNPLKRRVAP
jgi:hypothetical protein